MNTMDTAKPVETWVRTMLSHIFGRARVVFMVAVFSAVCAGLAASILPSIYSGDFSILIKAPELDLSLVGQNTDISFKPGQVGSYIIADEYQILTSHGLSEAVAEVYLARGYPFPIDGYLRSIISWLPFRFISPARSNLHYHTKVQQLADYLNSKFKVTPIMKSDVIKVEMRHHNRQFLSRVLNILAEELFQYRKKIWFNEKAQSFFTDQSSELLSQWAETQQKIQSLKSKSHEISPIAEKQELEKKVVANIARIQELNTQINESYKRFEYIKKLPLKKALTYQIREAQGSRLFWQLETDIGEAKSNIQALRSIHLKSSPVMKKALKHIYSLYREYKTLKIGLIQNTIQTLETERDVIKKNNAQLGSKLVKLGHSAQEMLVLDQKINLLRNQHELYQSKTSEIDVQNRLRSASGGAIRLISPPRVKLKPVWPNKTIIILAATLLAVVLTILVTVVYWSMRDTVTVPEEIVKDLGLPVLASFPLFMANETKQAEVLRGE